MSFAELERPDRPGRTVTDLYSLDGRVAVVTGGAGLYGRHMCDALAEAGAHVVVTSRDADACAAAADALRRRGLAASSHPLDLADEASILALRDAVLASHGRVDVLVNGSVHRQGSDPGHTSAADWAATSLVNSTGLFLISRYFAERMAAQGGGSIINIGSIYGVVGPTFDIYQNTAVTSPAFYAYDKGGMVNLTRYLACYYGPHGVRVNCLSPGGLRSEGQPEPFLTAYRKATPLGRLAGPDDIKGPILFLASDASAYVTGANLMVDGGWTAH
ncbi:SDR family oxidoreductase [Dactylosporangium sp. NPDC000555]|uniref:SDR family oxidoreductase n=1 Tax=Dactylosporangium sp. NPDC000555 TaxID=3154260 RepID=UPI003330B6CB